MQRHNIKNSIHQVTSELYEALLIFKLKEYIKTDSVWF